MPNIIDTSPPPDPRRDFFAAHAPGTVPEWFRPKYPRKRPECPISKHSSHTQTVIRNLSNGDMDEEAILAYESLGPIETRRMLAKAVKEFEDWAIAVTNYEHNQAVWIYFEWRRYYADMMITSLTPPSESDREIAT